MKMSKLLLADVKVMCLMLIVTISSSISSMEPLSNDTVDAFERRYSMPGLNHESYAVQGDIDIGALMSVTVYPRGFVCSKIVRPDIWILQYMEAIAFAVQWINNNKTLLPNVKLGFVIVDYCRTSNIALAQSLSFLPMQTVNVRNSVCTASTSMEPEDSSSSTSLTATTSFEALPNYDVVGVLGPQGSSSTVALSSLFSVAKIPLVSYMATSDELSSTLIHPYFMRLVPPDRHQVLAMLTFIAENDWSYISVVYGESSYGDQAFYNIRHMASQFGICVATSHSISRRTDFDSVVDNLLKYDRARVVILFIDTDLIIMLFAACDRAVVRNHFIWIGSDAISDKAVLRGQYWNHFHGTFTFMYYSKRVPQFESYFKKLRPGVTGNPWFNSYWESHIRCTFNSGTCLSEKNIKTFEKLRISSSVSLVIDSVYTFAHAIHNLINNVCPNVTGPDARSCIKGDKLMERMLKTSFDGVTGDIAFDSNGDLNGTYVIRQIVWENEDSTEKNDSAKGILVEAPVAYFEAFSGKITYSDRPISWDHLAVYPRVVPIQERNEETQLPESVCSRPCVLGEYKIQKELACCWECRRCRENERLVKKSTACSECEMFTWPDPNTNFTTCLHIPLSYASVSDTLSVIEVCLSGAAIAAQCVVVVTYAYFREHRVIKAASRELSFLQMVAIFSGYVTVILFQTTPTDTTCTVIYFMFCLSFTWLYSPLIVKAVRIYRIFRNSSKDNRRPRFVNPQSQLLMAGMLIAIQICLCVATYIMYQPSAKLTQPEETQKFVELSCDMTLPGLASFLTYNIFLVSLCSVLSFKTRKLPDNFNESRFVSMCVSTTLVIWLAFVPTYFTANRESVRVLLLSAALLINHTVALVFLFFPKVYAVVYVAPDQLTVTRFHKNSSTFTPQLPVVSNRIAPLTDNPV